MLILDFDGVLINSVDEVAVTALNTISSKMLISRESLPDKYLDTFRRNRFAARRGREMPYLAQWCIDNPLGDCSRQDLASFVAASSIDSANIEERFFDSRNSFVRRARNEWLSLNTPYYPLWKSVLTVDPLKLVILTTKNKQAVLDISSYFGLEFLPENVYSGDEETGKGENFTAIIERFHANKYIFIDDSIENLHTIDAFNSDRIRVELCLAEWGYIGPNDRTEAEIAGFKVLSQESAVKLVG